MPSPLQIVGGIFLLVACSMLVLNVTVTIKLWNSSSYSNKQIYAQTALVWLLPILGALLVWAVLREEFASRSVARTDAIQEPELAGLYSDPQSLGASHGGHDFHFGEH